MMSRTGVWAGSSSAAMHRRTMSRSVTIPRSRRSDAHTGSAPTLCRLMSRAASAAEEVGSTVTALGFIKSFTCTKTTLSVKIGVWPVCPKGWSFILLSDYFLSFPHRRYVQTAITDAVYKIAPICIRSTSYPGNITWSEI